MQNDTFYWIKLHFILLERKLKFLQYQHKGKPHTCEKSQNTATKIEDAIIIFRGIYFPDGHSLLMRNLVESMPRRLEDVLSREGNPSNY